MQGSKVTPQETYAMRRDDGLVRFTVSAVITRRTEARGSPHDYKTEVEGYIVEDGKTGKQREFIMVNPKALLGPYLEQVELKARKDAEDAKREAEAMEQQALRERLIEVLYTVTGLPRPNNNDYGAPFRLSFNDVDIRLDGIAALLKVLEAKS